MSSHIDCMQKCGCNVLKVFNVNVTKDMTTYKIKKYHTRCKEELPLNDRIVSLSCLANNSVAVVITKKCDTLYVYNFFNNSPAVSPISTVAYELFTDFEPCDEPNKTNEIDLTKLTGISTMKIFLVGAGGHGTNAQDGSDGSPIHVDVIDKNIHYGGNGGNGGDGGEGGSAGQVFTTTVPANKYSRVTFTIGKSCGKTEQDKITRRLTTANFYTDSETGATLSFSAAGGVDGVIAPYGGGKGGIGKIVLKETKSVIDILDAQDGTNGLGDYGGKGGLASKNPALLTTGGGGGGGGSGGLGGTPLTSFFETDVFLSILNTPITGSYGNGGHGTGSANPDVVSNNGSNGRDGRNGILGIGGDGGGGGGGGGGGSENVDGSQFSPGLKGYAGSGGIGGNGFALVVYSVIQE